MERVFGLDLLRSVAILMVLSGHARFFLRPLLPAAQSLSIFGFLGVELFFVLSGFLIGGIALRSFGPTPGRRDLFTFWVRRWFRTLPNYYLFLGINLGLSAWLGTPGDFAAYAVFLQNLAWPAPSFFNESWSLAVEEWFYLLFPLIVVVAAAIGARKRSAVAISLVLLFLISTGARFWVVASGNPSWDEGVRKVVAFRLDALMVGVVAAFLKEYHQPSWNRHRGSGVVMGTLLAAVVGWSYFALDRNGSDFARTALFSITSFSVFCFLPALDSWQSASGRAAAAVRAISLWSYSLYLCQLPVYSVLLSVFGDPERVSPTPSAVYIGGLTTAFVTLSIAVSALVYYSFERPSMAFRERFTTR